MCAHCAGTLSLASQESRAFELGLRVLLPICPLLLREVERRDGILDVNAAIERYFSVTPKVLQGRGGNLRAAADVEVVYPLQVLKVVIFDRFLITADHAQDAKGAKVSKDLAA